jgi:hypothetical protein
MADITGWIATLHRACDGGRNEACASRDHALAFLEERMSDPRDVGAHDVILASFLENLDEAGSDQSALVALLGPRLRERIPPT